MLDDAARAEAVALFDSAAEGNAVVVAQMLAERGFDASVRTVQRAVAERRRAITAAELARVRYETAPGRQMRIDFGERRVQIAGEPVTVHFLVAVLSYSELAGVFSATSGLPSSRGQHVPFSRRRDNHIRWLLAWAGSGFRRHQNLRLRCQAGAEWKKLSHARVTPYEPDERSVNSLSIQCV